VAVGEVAGFTRARLEAIVEGALREAGVFGTLPTPLEALREPARVRGVEPIAALPPGLGRRDRPLLGALWFEERTVYVDERQSAPRRRFTEAHELVHALCPWHEAILREDTEDELFRPLVDAVEAEANAGAGLLIFQGSEFVRRVADAPRSIPTALGLAREHGASRHATLHHYVQTHPGTLALLMAGRFPRRDGSLPVWRSVESAAFRRRFGQAAARYPRGLLPGTGLHALAEASRTTSDCPETSVRLGDRHRGRRFAAEAYDNRHAFLVLLVEPARARSVAAARGGP
jgi:hypothetical protein